MVTFAGSDEGAFLLNAAVPGQIKDAVVKGTQLVIRSLMPYAQAYRAMGSAQSFENATKYLVGSMIASISKKLEIELLYGQMGYGIVKNNETAGANVVVEITDASFAAGIWAGGEGMPVEFVRGGSVVANGNVAKVDLTAKTITIDTLSANLLANDDIFHKGAYGTSNDKEFAGIHKILTNAGSLFGINASSYTLWKGTEFAPSSTSVLSFSIVQQAIAKGVEKGLDSDVMVLVNPGHWDDLLTEQAALRMYDSSYSIGESQNGSKSIKFHSQNGVCEVIPSIYVKEGMAFILCVEDWARVGSTDLTFKRPDRGDEFFRDLTDYAGFELRAYTDQAVFCARPGRQVIITNLKVS